ncbi:MAG: TatD family hydrolase [Chitinophagaceae bacterium]
MLVDTHTHIYTSAFDHDRDDVVRRAFQNNIAFMLMPSIDKTDYELVLNTAKKYPNVCLPMMGLYPDSVNQNWQQDLQIVYQLLQQEKFIAVGEIGLDFLDVPIYKKEQILAFERQLQYALEFNLPVSVHSRNAMVELLGVIKKYQNGKLRGVQHCFSGTLEDAQQLIALGFYLGIGGRVTRKNSGICEILQVIGLDKVVLETDAPYVSPKRYSGKRNEPAFMLDIVDFLSEKLFISKEEIIHITSRNAEHIFNIQHYITLT